MSNPPYDEVISPCDEPIKLYTSTENHARPTILPRLGNFDLTGFKKKIGRLSFRQPPGLDADEEKFYHHTQNVTDVSPWMNG
ncbi:MAG: hypothetical protein A2939_00100 [Parcubacteria group bacterium RIFCSPLOWO2_01_FULL_48_18]|nr:MAG: hypothetical protein A3J67_05950 [Parcubacteria group bacterium RIFCSPHIGHO2_02_FULL_48_10b]OHB22168.1 MAG: hypothetical protein A2939_00100 [Parcubacteria group bacterium RIFCSPLOWO2_01_FULL_48_18]